MWFLLNNKITKGKQPEDLTTNLHHLPFILIKLQIRVTSYNFPVNIKRIYNISFDEVHT